MGRWVEWVELLMLGRDEAGSRQAASACRPPPPTTASEPGRSASQKTARQRSAGPGRGPGRVSRGERAAAHAARPPAPLARHCLRHENSLVTAPNVPTAASLGTRAPRSGGAMPSNAMSSTKGRTGTSWGRGGRGARRGASPGPPDANDCHSSKPPARKVTGQTAAVGAAGPGARAAAAVLRRRAWLRLHHRQTSRPALLLPQGRPRVLPAAAPQGCPAPPAGRQAAGGPPRSRCRCC